MSNEWSVLLSSDDQEFIQTIQFYYDLFRDMNAEYSQKVFALQSHYLGDVDHFQYPDSAQYWYLTFYGSFQSIKNAAAYIKEYTCIVCYDANEHMDELAELCSQLDLHEVYAFTHLSDAVYFAELMVVQYACDQLIGIDNANIKECLASDAQNIRMLSKKSINSFEEQFENVHRALLYVKSNYKSLYDFSVVFEEICKLLPNLNNYLFMAFFNNPLFDDEQGIVYVESEKQYSNQAPNS